MVPRYLLLREAEGNFLLNEVVPKRSCLKLESTPKFPRQNTVNNGLTQACGEYRGIGADIITVLTLAALFPLHR